MTTDHDPRLIAYRIAKAVRDGDQLTVTCPFCGALHHHGTGTERGPVYGHRVPDCGLGNGYYLVERSAR